MPDTTTSTYHLTQPEVGAAENTWGTSVNTNLANIDTLLANRVVKDRVGLDAIAVDPQVVTTGLRLSTQLDGVLAGSGQGVYENSAATARWVESRIMAQINHFFPIGMILMWSGDGGHLPPGWALCNGLNGTPNLSDRIILAAGNQNQPGYFGGVIQQGGGIGWHVHQGTQYIAMGYDGSPEFLDDYGGYPLYWPGDGGSSNLPYYVLCFIMKHVNFTTGM